MLTKLVLKNWRSHGQTEIGFAEGTNLLVGLMGSGKTSVLEAVCFALYGSFPAVQRREVSLEGIISAGETEAEVELWLRENGEELRVSRKIGKESRAELAVNGKVVEFQPRRVSREIEARLKTDYDVFVRAVYAEQNGIDDILRLEKRSRKEKIDELLGISKFENARKNLVSAANRVKAMRKELEKKSGEMNGAALKEEKEKLEKEIGQLNQKILAGEAELAAKEARVSEAGKRLEALERRSVECRRLAEELSGKKRALALITAGAEQEAAGEEKKKQACEALEKAGRELEQRASALLEKSRKADEAEKALWRAEQAAAEAGRKAAEKKEWDEKRARIPFSLKELEAELKKDAERAEQGRTFVSIQKAEIVKLKHSLQELERTATECPVCATPLTEQKRLELLGQKKKLEAEIAAVVAQKEAELAMQKKELEIVEKNCRAVEGMDEKIGLLKNADKELEALAKEKAARQEALAAETAGRATLESELAQIRKRHGDAERLVRDMERAEEEKRRADALAAEVRKLEESVAREKFDEKELERVRQENKKAEVEIGALKAECKGERRLAEEKNRLFSSLGRRLAEAEEVSAKLAKAAGTGEMLAVWENALLETQAALRENYVREINQALELVWPIVYPYKDFSSARLDASEQDYALQVKTARGEWVETEGKTSGGERACAALALRIAFATVLVPNLSWLFLDEPTHNLDAEAVAALARALRDEVPKIVRQIVVITHDENLKKAASGRTYAFSREKAGGKTVVEEVEAVME